MSSRFRTAVVAQQQCDCVSLIDTDTLAVTTLPAGYSPVQALVVEATGKAYVLNGGGNGGTSLTPAVLQFPGTRIGQPASITTIDLRTHETHDTPILDFGPTRFAADPSGMRLYVTGTNYYRTGESMPGFIQAFDTFSRSMVGTMAPVGRLPYTINVSADGREIYVGGNYEVEHPGSVQDLLQPAVFVLDSSSLGAKHVFDLPATRNLRMGNPQFLGGTSVDMRSGRLYVLNQLNNYLSVVDPAAGVLRTEDLEGFSGGVAVNPVEGNVIVSMLRQGHVAIFSLDGERLDTLAAGRAATGSEGRTFYPLTVDPATGVAYLSNVHDGSIAILRAPGHAPAQPAVVNLTDLWFKPADPGWGVYAEQQGTTLFAALFSYDVTGEASWLVMTNGARQPDGSFAGDLYRMKGPSAKAAENTLTVGSMRFTPTADGGATLAYTASGVAHTEALQRFRMGSASPACGWSLATAPVDADARVNYTSLWWDPDEPGWGFALSHQGDTSFGTLFTYDGRNNPVWMVMSNGVRKGPNAFGGTLYRSTKKSVLQAGSMSVTFDNPGRGTLGYTQDGVDVQKSIVRLQFAPLVSSCAS
jgi:DNA-binding beta-propeller fold protein YncE